MIKEADQADVEIWALMMQELIEDDPEQDHIKGDELLCELLIHLGYGAVIQEYKKITRWMS